MPNIYELGVLVSVSGPVSVSESVFVFMSGRVPTCLGIESDRLAIAPLAAAGGDHGWAVAARSDGAGCAAWPVSAVAAGLPVPDRTAISATRATRPGAVIR